MRSTVKQRMPTQKWDHPWPFPVSGVPGRGAVKNVVKRTKRDPTGGKKTKRTA